MQCPEIMAGVGTAPEAKSVTSLCRKSPWEPTPKSPSQPCGMATCHPTGQPGELKTDWPPYLPGSCAGRCPWLQCFGLCSASEVLRPTTTDLKGLGVQAQQNIRPSRSRVHSALHLEVGRPWPQGWLGKEASQATLPLGRPDLDQD